MIKLINFMDWLLDLAYVNSFNDVIITKSTIPLVSVDKIHVPYEVNFLFNSTPNNSL